MYIYYYGNDGMVIEKINSEYGILFTGDLIYFNGKTISYKDVVISRVCDYIDEKWLTESNVTVVE